MSTRYIYIILLLLLLPLPSFPQQDPCLQRLSDAENLFQTGIFEDIPDILEDCLPGYAPEEKQRAFRLIILSRYMNNDITGADETMYALLKEFPHFKPDVNDPADFQYVYKHFLVKRLFDAGITAGSELAWGILQEPWSPFGERFTYSIAGPGFSGGIFLNIHISKMISVSSQLSLSRYGFKIHYKDPVAGILQLTQTEKHTMLELPLYYQITFFNTKVKPYFKAGGQVGYLISSGTQSRIDRLDPSDGRVVFSSNSISRDNTEYREKINFWAGGGIGMVINFDKSYLLIEADYHQSINKILKKGSNRFDQNSVWTEGWFDSDFRLSKASLRIGFVKKLYRVKKVS